MPNPLLHISAPSRHRPDILAAAFFAWLFLAAGMAWAVVHTSLESSVPAADEVLTRAPARFELRFSGPVNPDLSALFVVTPSGDSLAMSLETAGDDDRILTGDAPPLTSGDHLVLWRTVSADGHPVSGEFRFTLVGDPATPTGEAEVAGPEGATGATELASRDHDGGQRDDPGRPEPAATTPPAGVVALAGLALLCLLGFAGLLWYCGSLPLLTEPRIGRSVSALGWGALLLLAADLARWVGAVVPPDGGLPGLAAALTEGTGLVGLSRIALVGLALALLPRRGRAAAAIAFASVLIGAVAGHSASTSPSITMPANAVHLGAVSIWFGGLLLLALSPDEPTDGSGAWRYVGVARAVSASALLSVILIAASGIIQSAWFVGDLAALTGTTYGRGVLAKCGGLAILIGFGAYHRFRILPAVGHGGDGRGLRRTVRLEAIVMLAVVMLAAWLARVPPPSAH